MVQGLTKKADAPATEAVTKKNGYVGEVKCKEIKNEEKNIDGLQIKKLKQM